MLGGSKNTKKNNSSSKSNKNKEYTLLETTVPNPIGYDGGTEYSDLKIIPLS